MLIFGESHLRRMLTSYTALHYRKMHPCIEQSNSTVSLSPFRSSPDCVANTSGYNFRKGQEFKSARLSCRPMFSVAGGCVQFAGLLLFRFGKV